MLSPQRPGPFDGGRAFPAGFTQAGRLGKLPAALRASFPFFGLQKSLVTQEGLRFH